jgi:radical SAM superfamily enzyme YgiQ (UPF0313 family)
MGMSTGKCDVLLIGYEEVENLGLRSIASFLSKHNVRVRIVPCDKFSQLEILSIIRDEKPKIVGFSLIFQRMLHEFAGLISYLRQNGVSAHFTIGGHFPTFEYGSVLELIPELDSVVRGEGEETLLELFKRIDNPKSWFKIKGLVYRRNGEIVVNPPRPLIQNLDDLPFPLRDTITKHRGVGVCPILASRGCYYNCSFCSIQSFYAESPGPKRRSRSPGNVVREMEMLFRESDVRVFIFEDDDFVMKGRANRQWIKDFLHELRKRNLDEEILWRISCRIDDVDTELFEDMIDAGLMSIYLGIESGNDMGLKIYNKHYTVGDVYNAIDALRKLKLPFEFGFMILNPYSTFDTVKEDVAFLKKVNEKSDSVIQFTKMVPYAGTPIARKLREEGRLTGTIEAPDYTYEDPRLELLQLFFTQAFHHRNFDRDGIVERLRFAKFDAIILEKFFGDEHDVEHYKRTVSELIRKANEVCLENMSMAVNFMERYSEEEILDNWWFLDGLVMEQRYMDLQIMHALNRIMSLI